MKGILRWVFYKDRLIEVLERFSPPLKSLLTDSDTILQNEIEELQSFIHMQCVNAGDSKNENADTNRASTSPEKCEQPELLDIDQIPELHIFDKYPKWKANCSDKETCHLFLFSGNDGYAEVEVIINCDKTWLIVLEGKVKCSAKLEWADIPSHLTTVSELEELMSVIQSSHICRGCPFEPFEAIVPETNQPIFHTKNKEAAAFVEIKISHFHQKSNSVNWLCNISSWERCGCL